MKKSAFLIVLLAACTGAIAQTKTPEKKKSAKEVIEQLPEMLIAQPDKGPDSNANKLLNDNLSLEINPLWQQKGTMLFSDFKLNKADAEPLDATFPFAEKKLVQTLAITPNNLKKTAAEKKQSIITQIKTHLQAYYKEAGITISGKDMDEKVAAMVTGPEAFTTTQGKQGELYYFNDVQSQQTNYIILLLIPGATPATCTFVQFTYTRFLYDTLPEDPLDVKFFVYPDEQQGYIDFTKKILKTLVIK